LINKAKKKASTSNEEISVESFKYGGYSRGKSEGMGRNQRGREGMNLGCNYDDFKRCYSCSRLGPSLEIIDIKKR
jgi:hypothetical protein